MQQSGESGVRSVRLNKSILVILGVNKSNKIRLRIISRRNRWIKVVCARSCASSGRILALKKSEKLVTVVPSSVCPKNLLSRPVQ